MNRVERLVAPPHIRLRIALLGFQPIRQPGGFTGFGVRNQIDMDACGFFKFREDRAGNRFVYGGVKGDGGRGGFAVVAGDG